MKDRYYKVPADVRRYTEICDSRPYQIDAGDNTSWLVYRHRQYHRLITWRLYLIQEAVFCHLVGSAVLTYANCGLIHQRLRGLLIE